MHQELNKGLRCVLCSSQLPLLWQDHRAAARMFRDERDQKTAEIYKAMRRGDYQLSDKLKTEVSRLLCWHLRTQEVMTVHFTARPEPCSTGLSLCMHRTVSMMACGCCAESTGAPELPGC